MPFGALILAASAAEPPPITPAAGSDGFWRTELLVPAPLDEVRAALEDPIASARFSPDISSVDYVSRGACPTLHVRTAGVATISYEYRRCATPTGWHETLVGSDALEVYEVRWTLEPAGDATRVSHEIRVDTSFPTPEFVIARQLKASIRTILGGLYRAVTGESER